MVWAVGVMFAAPVPTWGEGLDGPFPRASAGVVTCALRDAQPGQGRWSCLPGVTEGD